MRYTIRLENCAFFARHGVHDEEERLGQRFFIDADLTVIGGRSIEQDDIDGTVDYGKAFGVIEDIVVGRRRNLIEALALDIAHALCERFPSIERALVTVRKPNAPVTGILDHVEVSIAWPQ